MYRKTDLSAYVNDDDFVEQNGQMNELTVTITLKEYRDLISNCTKLEIELDAVTRERDEAKEKVDTLSKAFLTANPDWIKEFGEALSGSADTYERSEEDEEGEEEA